MPNTYRRRRRDETVLSRRVGVGGVYMNSQLAHDDCRRIRRCERSRWPWPSLQFCSQWRNIYTLHVCKHSNLLCSVICVNFFYNFFSTMTSLCRHLSVVSKGNCKLSDDCRRVPPTRQFCRVGGVYWTLRMHRVLNLSTMVSAADTNLYPRLQPNFRSPLGI